MVTVQEQIEFNRWFNLNRNLIRDILLPQWLAADTEAKKAEVLRKLKLTDIKKPTKKKAKPKRTKAPDYHKYINSKEWKTKSAAWRQETPNCERCGTSENLQCHHLHYNTLGREQRCDILVVCYACHCALHKCDKLGKTKRAKK